MRTIQIAILATIVTSAVAQNHPVRGSDAGASSDGARLIGAWHLASITGPDGRPVSTVPKGMLIYTRDGHMSVQLMYPKMDNALSNQYVQAGYEASFGSYDVNQATHMVTHHVQSS